MDEDEEACLQEYIYIVITVTVNDHDGPILSSCNKSLSRKGNSLQGCWKTYESSCGIADPERQPALILVFVLGNIVYEFVCCPSLIAKLEKHQSSLHRIELGKQTVLALKDIKDIDVLASLMVEDEHFALKSENYLRYRVPDLHPILQLMPQLSGPNARIQRCCKPKVGGHQQTLLVGIRYNDKLGITWPAHLITAEVS